MKAKTAVQTEPVNKTLLFTPEPRTGCVAAGEHDSAGSLGFAKRICMPKLPVTGHGVNSTNKTLYTEEHRW